MARRAEGWKLHPSKGSTYRVRFTHGGKRYELGTGERNRAQAARKAQEIWSEIVLGQRRPEQVGTSKRAFDEFIVDEWLEDMKSTHDPRTVRTYENYCSAQLMGFFQRLDGITTGRAAAYTRMRLAKVLRKTVLKELSALRSFVRWCHEKGYLESVPLIESPPRKATGTPDRSRRRKRHHIDLTEQEISRVLEALPEWSTRAARGRPGSKYPVRAYFQLAWETALRPETLDNLTAPGDFNHDAKSIQIRDEIDKARFGRALPISEAARAALAAICPDRGLIFGAHRSCRGRLLREAARAAKLDEEKILHITAYDFRHARLTFWGEEGEGNLPGIMYLAGHKHASTSSRYLHAREKQARRVLLAGSGSNSGAILGQQRGRSK